MSNCSVYRRMSARDWAWGTTAYWKLCSSFRGSFNPSKWRNFRTKARRFACCNEITSPSTDKVQGKFADQKHFSELKGRFSCGFQDRLYHYSECVKIRNYSSLGSRQLRKFLSTSCVSLNLDEQRRDVLTPCEIDSMLRFNEKTISDFVGNGILFCASNQLSSNQPNEDKLVLATCQDGKGLLAGVIDGHGGYTFGGVVQQRLPYYIAAALASEIDSSGSDLVVDDLVELLMSDDSLQMLSPSEAPYWHIDLHKFLDHLKSKQPDRQGYISLISNPLRQVFGTEVMGDYADGNVASDAKSLIQDAFLQLDDDLLTELRHHAANNISMSSLHKGLSTSGCCALMVFLRDNDLYVANAGDCRAVLGTRNEGVVTAVQLTHDHTAVSNPDEVSRILTEHPQNESRTCIQYGRLLGRLAPLRAFGDIQFKLSPERQQEILTRHLPSFKPMPAVKTPPYLTVRPDVFHFQLQCNDQFLVLASDGLWDMLSNEEVVWLVDGFLSGRGPDLLRDKAVLSGICPDSPMLDDLNDIVDGDNVATFLIRYALGGANLHALSSMLTLPHPEVRMYRDDITVMVLRLENGVSPNTTVA